MGESDIENLHKIYRKCVDYCKKEKLPFHFQVDSGEWETALEFIYDDGKWQTYHPPLSKDWSTHPVIFCPDILDYKNKLIIELEEEGQKRLSGARLARKGHGPEGDIPNKRDTNRGDYYSWGKFRVLRFYEADLKEENWEKLEKFLVNV